MPASPGPVLIIEDDPAVRDSLRFALEIEGLEVRAYADVAAFLVEGDPPRRGCVVLDERPADIDSLSLVRDLRARDIQLPVVLITEAASWWSSTSAALSGIRLVQSAPVDSDALVASILDALAAPKGSADEATT